jgi:hypothetical protein
MTATAAANLRFDWRRWLKPALFAAALTAFVAAGVLATLIFPPAALLFVTPLAVVIAIKAPPMRAAPKSVVMPLIYLSVLLLPLWPVYIHLKPGPLPILTPPRLLLYALSTLWAYDMVVSPLRRGQLASALKRGRWLAIPIAILFVLGLISLPMAEGRALAAPEFIRQVIIWLAPFLAFATYVRRPRQLKTIVALLAIAAGISGAGAVAEFLSGRLLANLLSPFIGAGGAEWLEIAKAEKVRDGVFRAQFTHTHPLSLGEFLALMSPVAFSFALFEKCAVRRALWGLCLAFILAGAWATNSRASLLVIALALAVCIAFYAFRVMRTAGAWRLKPAAALAALLLALGSPLIAAGAYKVVVGEAGQSTARSSQTRLDQIEQAWPKIKERLVGGYGTGRAARVLGFWGRALTIDNYYLTLALDLGLPGPLAFLAVIFGMGVLSARGARSSVPGMSAVYVGLAGAAGGFLIMRSVVSQTGNLSIVFVLLGAMAGVAAMRGRKTWRTG